MKEEKKQKKFHDALLKLLYPSQEEKEEEEEHNKVIEPLYHLPEGLEIEENNESSSCSKDNEDGDLGSEKRTRAQRKRLRKQKLKEAASQRRKIVGPLLPSSIDDSKNVLESVRQNAALEPNTTTDSSGEPAAGSKSNKLKQRRKSKKLNSSKID